MCIRDRFLRCSVWREAAENVAESLTKGMRVIVQGRLKARSYDDRDGNRRTSWELDVDEVGPALRFATAKVTRAQRGGGGGGGFGGGQSQEDPWATGPGGSGGGGGNWGNQGGGQGGYGQGAPQGAPAGGGHGGNQGGQQGGGWNTAPSYDEPPF